MRLKLHDITATVDDRKPLPRTLQPQGLVIHRTGVDREAGIDLGGPREICAAFAGRDPRYPQVAAATGGHIPYSALITTTGHIYQTLPLYDVGPHALVWSEPRIGLAAIGDYRHDEPTLDQWCAAVDFAALLCTGYDWDPLERDDTGTWLVAGHSPESPHGSKDPGKLCPGPYWPMDDFRVDVKRIAAEIRIQLLQDAGVRV